MTNSELDEEYRRSHSIQDMARIEKKCTSILATFFAALGALSFGYSLGYSSSALVDLKYTDVDSNIRFTTTEQGSWFAVSYSLLPPFFLWKLSFVP